MGYLIKNDKIKVWLLIAAVIAVYIPFLNNPLVFDDSSFFTNGIFNYTNTPFNFTFRWFPYTTFGVTWVFFADNPLVYRVQNLLLHALNTVMLFVVLRLWLSLFIAEFDRQKVSGWGVWLGALVFACHPLAVYGTGYLVQRSILMATFFTLLLHFTYIRGLLDGNWRSMALAITCYFLAVFSKEHSLLAPAILLPLSWVLRNKIQLDRRILFATWLGFFVIALIVVLRVKGVLGQAYESDAPVLFGTENLLSGMPMLHGLSVMTQAGLYFKYLLLMFIPNPAWMSIDMREPFVMSLAGWTGWVGLLGFVAYGVISLFWLLRGGSMALIGLALLYPWCFYLVEFSTVRIQEIFVLYRSYLWLPGIVLLIPVLVVGLTSRRIIWIGALLSMLLIPLAWNRLWVFADAYRLWDDAVVLLKDKDALGAQRIYYNRAYAAANNKDWESAIRDYKHALKFNDAYPQINLALAGAYVQSGRLSEALAEYDKVILAHPDNAEVHYHMVFALKRMHQDKQARYHLKKSCALGKQLACTVFDLSEKERKNKKP